MTGSASARTVRAVLMALHRNEEIAARIKQALTEAGLKPKDLAPLLGVEERTVWNYVAETNPRVPWKHMDRISEITGRSEQWLRTGEEDAEPASQVMRRLSKLERMLTERLALEEELERKLDLLLSNLSAAEPVSDLLDDMESRQPDAEAAPRTKRKRRR